MEEDNDGALKRQYNNDQHQDSQDDSLTTSPKRFKLKTDLAEGNLSQEPLDNDNNNNDNADANEEAPYTQNGDLSLSITNGQASVASRNQQQDIDNTDGIQHNKQTPPPPSSSSPFALHPILDELTNKSIYPSYEPPNMRMSMSAILTETGKGYHSNNTDTATSTLPNSLMASSSTSRGQSLPPPPSVNHFPHHPHHHHHHPSSTSEIHDRPTSSEPPSQQHHHRTSSYPTIPSAMTQLPLVEPVEKNDVPSSPDNQQELQQRQSITNEQLVRALTTSIPLASDQTASASTTSDVPTTSSTPQAEVKQEEPTKTTTTIMATAQATADTYTNSLSPSQPDFGAALRRLSGVTAGLDQLSSGKKEDVSPSEILGSALAAVARSQHHGTTAAAAAIGNLAAITANISHILNNNNNSGTNGSSSPPPPPPPPPSQPSSSPSHLTTSTPPPPAIPSPLVEQNKDNGSTSELDHQRRRSTAQASPLAHPGALSTMLDQAMQLGRTQQYKLQQDESSATGTRTNHGVTQETIDGMKRVAEAAASVAAAATASPPSTSSPVRLHNHNHNHHHHQQPSPQYSTGTPLLPPNQQQHPQHHHHPYHPHHPHHPYQAQPLHYGPMMYSTPPASSHHTATPPMYPPPPSPVVQTPKVVINNEQVWKAMKGKKETNLGFYLYQPSMLLPNLQDHLNGIVQVRIPARYLSYQNPKVKKRAIWGTGIYTDDSDVVSMVIHSGKFIPAHHDPELESGDPFLLAVAGKNVDFIRAASNKRAMSPKTYLRGRHEDDTVPNYDIKVTLRVLPKLQDYTSTIQHRIKSRQWGGNHDGVSFFVEKVEQLKKGEARPGGRSSLKNNLFRYESYRQHAPRLMNDTETDKPPNPIDHVV